MINTIIEWFMSSSDDTKIAVLSTIVSGVIASLIGGIVAMIISRQQVKSEIKRSDSEKLMVQKNKCLAIAMELESNCTLYSEMLKENSVAKELIIQFKSDAYEKYGLDLISLLSANDYKKYTSLYYELEDLKLGRVSIQEVEVETRISTMNDLVSKFKKER